MYMYMYIQIHVHVHMIVYYSYSSLGYIYMCISVAIFEGIELWLSFLCRRIHVQRMYFLCPVYR